MVAVTVTIVLNTLVLLHDSDIGNAEAYIQIRCDTNKPYISPVVKTKDNIATWNNATYKCTAKNPNSISITFDVYDKDTFTRDDLLGSKIMNFKKDDNIHKTETTYNTPFDRHKSKRNVKTLSYSIKYH